MISIFFFYFSFDFFSCNTRLFFFPVFRVFSSFLYRSTVVIKFKVPVTITLFLQTVSPLFDVFWLLVVMNMGKFSVNGQICHRLNKEKVRYRTRTLEKWVWGYLIINLGQGLPGVRNNRKWNLTLERKSLSRITMWLPVKVWVETRLCRLKRQGSVRKRINKQTKTKLLYPRLIQRVRPEVEDPSH